MFFRVIIMSRIVAARFDTFDSAQLAANALLAASVPAESLHTFFVNPSGEHARFPLGGDRVADPQAKGAPYGALGGAALLGTLGAVAGSVVGLMFDGALIFIIGGAGLGAYIGSLGGAMYALGRKQTYRSSHDEAVARKHEGHHAGVLLAVHITAEDEDRISGLLKQSGGIEIERARGLWKDGQWVDFDPLLSPDLEQDKINNPMPPAIP